MSQSHRVKGDTTDEVFLGPVFSVEDSSFSMQLSKMFARKSASLLKANAFLLVSCQLIFCERLSVKKEFGG